MTRFYLVKCSIIFLFALVVSACSDKKRYFEEHKDIENGEWFKNIQPEFTFVIEDTSKAYNLFYTIRNSLDYPFHNLYLQYYLSDSIGRVVSSDLQEMYLFNPRTGEPSGSGDFFASGSFGDVYDHKYPALINYSFDQPGEYTFSFKQFMRDQDPLEEVLSVGLRIETVP